MKSYLIAGLSLMLIAAASIFLPASAMKFQDEKQVGKAETEAAQEIVLNEQASMTLSQKLELIRKDTVSTLVLVNGKNYTRDTIGAQFRSEIETLKELGILPDFDTDPLYLAASEISFFMDQEDSEKSMMLWNGVAYSGTYQMEFLLDDETGKLLGFSLHDWQDGSTAAVGEESFDGKGGTEAYKIAESSFSFDEEALTELAEKWADYLSCTLVEVEPYVIEGLSGEEQLFLKEYIERMVKKGYTEQVAYEYAMEELGYPAEFEYWTSQVYIHMTDANGEVGCYLRAREEELAIYSE